MRRALCVLPVMIAISGCSRSASEAEISTILGPDFAGSEGGGRAATDGNEFNFGHVVARGQLLQHEFTFTNSTNQPLRLISAVAMLNQCRGNDSMLLAHRAGYK
jgi:hypothetical protein